MKEWKEILKDEISAELTWNRFMSFTLN